MSDDDDDENSCLKTQTFVFFQFSMDAFMILCFIDFPIDALSVPAHQRNAAHRLAANITETAEPSQPTEGANCGNITQSSTAV